MAIAMTCLLIVSGSGVCHGAMATPPMMTGQSIDVDDSERLEISVRDGVLVINVTRSTNIKIFSILGQLVLQRTIPAGVTRIKLPARGIYIFKASGTTRRITV